MNPLFIILPVLAVALGLVLVARWAQGFRRAGLLTACNVAEGTHQGTLSKLADAALTTPHLLAKWGSDGDHIAICGASDKPLGSVPDEVATVDLTTLRVPVNLLGLGESTRLGVASEAIALTDDLYTAASGKIQNLPTAAGTYYRIGRPVTTASADGDVIEYVSCVPVAVTVT